MLSFKSLQPKGAFAFGLDVPKLRLDYRGLVVVEGQNGAGKSSIMNSLVQTVFGKNDTSGAADEICNVVLKEGCDIIVELQADGKPWTVELARGFKRPGSNARVTDLFLFNDKGEDKREEKMGDTLAMIHSLVGMNFEQFRATSYMGVQTVSKFLDGTDSDRMKVITPFLGLSVWDRAVVQIRALKKAAMDALLEAKSKYEFSTESLAELEAELLTDEEKLNHESRIEDAQAAIDEVVSEIDRIKASTTSVDNRLRVLESDLVRVKKDADVARSGATSAVRDRDFALRLASNSQPPTLDRTALDQVLATKAEVTKESQRAVSGKAAYDASWIHVKLGKGQSTEIDALLKQAADIGEKRDGHHVEATTLRKALDRMPKGELGECPTCFTSVTAEHLASVRLDYENRYAEATKQHSAAVAAYTSLIEKAQTLLDTMRAEGLKQAQADLDATLAWEKEQMAAIAVLQATEEAKVKAQVEEYRATQVKSIQDTYEAKSKEHAASLVKAEAAVKATQAEIDKIKLDPTTLGNRQKVATLEAEVTAFRKEIDGIKVILSNHALRVTQRDAAQKACDDTRTIVAGLETRVDDLEFMDAHTGDNGIKRYKLRGCLGFMNDKLSQYMSILELPLQVWFQDRVLKKKSAKKNPKLLTDDDFTDQFEVMVTDGPKEGVPIGMYSGGERTLIALSLLGVLWETANISGQGGSNLLMIDEPFGLLREENRDRALKLFEHWASLDKCVIVSDNTGAIDGIGRRAATWSVRKENHVSTIVVREG